MVVKHGVSDKRVCTYDLNFDLDLHFYNVFSSLICSNISDLCLVILAKVRIENHLAAIFGSSLG